MMPEVRSNLQYVCLMKLNNANDIKKVCEEFLADLLFPDARDPITKRPLSQVALLRKCTDWYREATKDYNFIILENINDFALYRFRTPST
jgi:hypothetical protein